MRDRPRLLVIDDTELLRRAAVRLLESAGYEVDDAATGEEGLRVAQQRLPDVVLLDVMLPDVDGVDVCRRLKAVPELVTTQVILISGHVTGSDAQAAGLEAGADDYVTRPIPNRELLARVAAAVRIRRAGETLRETQGQLRGIIDASPLPIFVLSPEGVVRTWNAAAESLSGWSAEEVVGSPLPIVSPADAGEFADLRRRVVGGETLRNVPIVRHSRDGTPVHLLMSAAPLRGPAGQPWGIMAVLQDITERVRLNDALRRERDLLARVTETSQVGIAVVSRSGRFEFANTHFAALCGLTQGEILRRDYNDPVWRLSRFDGSTIEDVALPFGRVLATGAPVRDVQHAIERPDGTRVLLSVNGAPLLDSAGQMDRVVFTVQDVTEQVAAEQRTTQLNLMLQAIRAIDRMLVRTVDRDLLVAEACRILADSGVVDEAWILLQDGTGGPVLAAQWGAPDPVALSDRLATAAFRHGIDEVLRTDAVWQSTDAALQTVRTVLMAPLSHAGKRYGVLGVTLAAAFGAGEENRALLEDIAADIAYALRGLETAAAASAASAELQTQVNHERDFQQRLQALVEVANALVLTDSVDDLCQRAVELASRWLGFERIGIWLHDPADPGHLHGSFGIDEQGRLRDERGQTIDATPEVMAWAARGDTSTIHVERGDLFDDRRRTIGTGTWLRALLWNGDDFAGIVSTDNLLTGRAMTSRDADLLSLLASSLSNLIFRKRSEASQQAREAFYRVIFETTGAATLVVNHDLTVALANAESEILLGYPRAELEAGMDSRSLIAADSVDGVVARHQARRAGEAPPNDHYEVAVVDREGNRRDTMAYVALVPGTEQSVVSLLDITAQKAATARAQRHAAWQQALNDVIAETTRATDIRSLVEAVLVHAMRAFDADMGICRWLQQQHTIGISPGALDLIDSVRIPSAASGEVVSIDDWQRLDVPWLAQIGAAMVNHGVGASLAIPVAGLPEGGSGVIAEVSGGIAVATAAPRAWTAEEQELMAAIAHQLSAAGERLRLLDQVRRQAQELQAVLDTVPEGVVLLTPDGQVLLANPVARQALSDLTNSPSISRLRQLGGRSLHDFLVPPQEGLWHELLSGTRAYEAVAKPLAESDALEGWVLVLRDVTVERRRERELRQQERLAAVGRLAAGIAHDFNNIMAVIVLYSQMVAQQPDMGRRAKEQARVIYDQARRATDLIEQILDFSRSAPLERHDLELLPYLKEIIRLWERTLPENITIDLVFDEGDFLVVGDPTRLQQAFMNLATNSRDAMPDGGTLTIRLTHLSGGAAARDAASTPTMGRPPDLTTGAWIRVDFADTGHGIPLELQARVFEPFFTTKPAGKGTGLGLAQVYGIVKQHDGEVAVTSTPGQGTTVSIYLPISASERRGGATPTAELQPVSGQGELILVVEDNAVTRATLVDVLDELGYRVVEAATGKAALAVIETAGDEVQAILTDAIMPEMGGAQLLATLADRHDDHPVVILSGYLPAEQQAGLRAMPNFVRWLTKPVDLYTISQAIREALARRPARR